jgi:single-stranded-DNA-specific exonuclease
LFQTVQALGADVSFYIPTRQQGHGLDLDALESIISGGTSLIVTCDTGITAYSEVARANSLGAQVIITDHHVPGDHFPPAAAVVNPHCLPPEHPLATLPGVGVAYQLAKALVPHQAERALDLVALGIVADVATLTGDARYLVQLGLQALRHTERPGLRAVYEASGLRREGITEEHCAFVLAPRFNALGRLANASRGVELLLTQDPLDARILATEMEGLNARRQWLTTQVRDAARAQIEHDPALLSRHEALVLSHPSWPSGIVGIVAARLAELYGKPAVLIAAPTDRLSVGSGRSIPGLDLIKALTECRHLLLTYGGHSGAAGFTIEPQRIPELRTALSRAVAAQMQHLPQRVLALDAYVDLPDLTLDLVSEISRLAPFGPGNPTPTLAIRHLRVLSHSVIGRTHEHRRVHVEDAQQRTQAVFWWQGTEGALPQGTFDLAVSVRASDYSGRLEPQVEWLGARVREREVIDVSTTPAISVHDLRQAKDPHEILQDLIRESGLQVWAEVSKPLGLASHTRSQLRRSERLLIWTLPPGPREMQEALDRVQPREVVLFAHGPGLDETGAFLSRLAGLVKHVLGARGGQAALNELAAATAQRVSTVLAGLDWLEAHGQIAIIDRGDNLWQLALGNSQVDRERLLLARARVDALLVETDAYRKYASDAPAEALIPGIRQVSEAAG